MDLKRAWPTFLGIGVPKAGSTWLYDLLKSHNRVWMPPQRSEVHYFDRYFERGPEWYAQFFPAESERGRYSAIGEYTPHYMYHREVFPRVASVPTIARVLTSLRNPVDRAYSHYGFRVRLERYRGTFETFLEQDRAATEWGYYAKHLRRWVERFGRDGVLALVFEDAVRDVPRTKAQLAAFLGIDAADFPEDEPGKVNAAFRPQYRVLHTAAVRIAAWLRRHDLYGPIEWGKRAGFMRLVTRKSEQRLVEPMRSDTRQRLTDLFRDDMAELERLLDLDLSSWRRDNAATKEPSAT